MDIEQAIANLGGSDAALQTAAAQWFAQHAEAASPAAAALVAALATDDPSLRDWVTSALESLGSPPAEQLPEIAEHVLSANEDIAYWSITLLGRCEAAATDFLSVIEQSANDSPSEVIRRRAEWAAKRISG